jgi:hypothetical protein
MTQTFSWIENQVFRPGRRAPHLSGFHPLEGQNRVKDFQTVTMAQLLNQLLHGGNRAISQRIQIGTRT